MLEVLQPTLCGCTRVINPCKLLEAHRHPLLWDPLSESGTCHLSPLIAPQMLKNLSASGDCHPHASGLIRKAPFLALYNSTNLYHHQQHIPKSPTPDTRADDKMKTSCFQAADTSSTPPVHTSHSHPPNPSSPLLEPFWVRGVYMLWLTVV